MCLSNRNGRLQNAGRGKRNSTVFPPSNLVFRSLDIVLVVCDVQRHDASKADNSTGFSYENARPWRGQFHFALGYAPDF
ncbi:hypothetical protein BXY66_1691 [Shimia isoporae]|uniref:Uncharacterized protein n=1 Tax=Shimia isoporae TaxID=647720 RepID=A0A4R1NMJ2_9RHOB|nr:hypothetical protein BXY66_1691 [Shimia isoporae]